MKSLDEVLNNFKSDSMDHRDAMRLAQFVPEESLSKIGLTLNDDSVGTHEHIPFTKENILRQLKEDVAFGFEKALNKRGISSSEMHGVVRMWNGILEDGLENFEGYAQYGLPLFKATALKYGFDNPIGDDTGEESQYKS